MWNLIKAEMVYNKLILTAFAISIAGYTVFALLRYQLLEGPKWEIDYWGGILGLIFYLTLFIIWSRRIKEFRARALYLTPISLNKIGLARLLFILILMLVPLIYLSVVHLIILEQWHAETLSILGQLGMTYIVFTTFIFVRDFWLININKSYTQKIIFAVLIITIAGFIFFFNYSVIRPAMYELNSGYLGLTSFYFIAIIFILFSVKTYTKRKSFLI